MSGTWFLITEGEDAGRLHLSGWMGSALLTADGWIGYATCPVCFAWVGTDGAFGDRTWRHEQWHAATDFPVPPELVDRHGRWHQQEKEVRR